MKTTLAYRRIAAGLLALFAGGCGLSRPDAQFVPPLESNPRAVQANYYAPGYGGSGGSGMWYVGGSVQPLVSHFADADELKSGPGFGLRGGFFADSGMQEMSFDALIALELSFETSRHDHEIFSTIDATFTRFLIGGRLVDPRYGLVRPFVSLGVGFYVLNFSGAVPGSDLAGFGGYVGTGVELMLAENFSIEFGAQVHSWTDEDALGDTLTLGAFQFNIGAALNY